MTAETPPAPPAMNDLMDCLVDEDPLVLVGLLSTKVGSSLYKIPQNPSVTHTPTPTKALTERLTIVEERSRSTEIARWRFEGTSTFAQTAGHVIMSGRVRDVLPVGRNIPIVRLL